MNETQLLHQSELAASLETIEAAALRLAEARQQLARLAKLVGEDRAEANFYLEEDVKLAQEELQQTITSQVASQAISYDQSLELMSRYDLPHQATAGGELAHILAELAPDRPILLKPAYFYPQDVCGVVASQPFLIPYLRDQSAEPAVIVEIVVDGISEAEIIPITQRSNGDYVLVGVELG